MFRFDPSKLTVTYELMKTVTTALGGSMHIVDRNADPHGPTELIRVKVPFAVTRKFIKDTKFTKYVKPVKVAVLRYEDTVVNIERDIAANIRGQEENPDAPMWRAYIDMFVNDHLEACLGDKDWYFDGRYIYNLNTQSLETLRNGGGITQPISSDHKFRMIEIPCIDLYESNKPVWKTGIVTEPRGVIGFSSGDAFAVTPPIWKNVTAIGSSASMDDRMPQSEHEDYIDTTTGISITEDRERILIDLLDENFSLNLNFTMNSAKAISNIFGFDAIEPLQLPEVMLALTTVNIPGLPKSIKSTFSIGLSPSHGLTWLMGLLAQSKTLDDFVAVRGVIKYLTTKGMFHKSSTKRTTLFATPEHTIPPMLDVATYVATEDNSW